MKVATKNLSNLIKLQKHYNVKIEAYPSENLKARNELGAMEEMEKMEQLQKMQAMEEKLRIEKIKEMYEEDYSMKIMIEEAEKLYEGNSLKIIQEMKEMNDEGFFEDTEDLYDEDCNIVDSIELKLQNEDLLTKIEELKTETNKLSLENRKQNEDLLTKIVVLKSETNKLSLENRKQNEDFLTKIEDLKVENNKLRLENRNLNGRNECIVCGEQKNIAVLPCGHLLFCADCEFEAMMPHQTDPDIPAEPWPKCPVCRTEIEDTLQVFM